MKKIFPLILILLLSAAFNASASGDRKQKTEPRKYSNEYLDTVKVDKELVINDYVMVGVEYGGGVSRQLFNPPYLQDNLWSMDYYGISITKYSKMFGFMPYFGLQAGLFHGIEGYKMKENKETGSIAIVNGAIQCSYKVIDIPVTAQFHYDMDHFKLLASAGIYGGYRYAIERVGPMVTDETRYTFLDTDHRIDYGLKGGAGFGIVFDPFEVHVKANVRYAWSTLYDPNYRSEYYFSFAYPLDINLSVGLFVQLGSRSGKDKATLRKEAKAIVYGNN
ncbi:MAG: PorT family protein [Bacteroidales bacterium]|nr:PorT family protein [Bacteroidales bacterium]